MGNNTSQVDESEISSDSREITIRLMIQSYLNTVQYRFRNNPVMFDYFMEYAKNLQEDERIAPEDFETFFEDLFEGHDDLIQGYYNLRCPFKELRTLIRQKEEKALREEREVIEKIANVKRKANHLRACEAQSQSMLLCLPREIRDVIWKYVVCGNIIHVSRSIDSPYYSFHSCVAPNGLKSAACPSGEGDHAECSTSGPSTFPSYRLICNQINLELPDPRSTFFSENAFHFDNLEGAEEYIFNLEEEDRAAIKHLRLPVPYSLSTEQGHLGLEFQAWESLMNYFSCPWVRKTLRHHVHNRHDAHYLKKPWYFYYPSSFYTNKRNRLYKRWQIALGDTSWDMKIALLRYKGEPNIDIGMNYPESPKSLIFPYPDTTSIYPRAFTTEFEDPPMWQRSLLRFRQYSGLNFHFWDSNGVIKVPKHERFVEALHEKVSRSEIGPWKVVEFRGSPFGNPDWHSLPIV